MTVGETTQQLWLFGTAYTKQLQAPHLSPVGIAIQGSNMLITPMSSSHQLHHPDTRKLVDSFLKRTARAYILPRVEQLATTMNTSPKQIRLKETISRWGSCSSKGNLNFNWRLVHFPTHIIDYVIIHELAHLTHMNHSRAFWNLVAKFDPEFPNHQGWLKRWPQQFARRHAV